MECDRVEFCDNVIIVDDRRGSEDDNNLKPKKIRSSKRTDLQTSKLLSFMEIYPDFTQGKADEQQLLAWDKLTTELNLIGPPIHSSIRWRKIWTDFKADQKRNPTPTNKTVLPYETVLESTLIDVCETDDGQAIYRSLEVKQNDPPSDRSKHKDTDDDQNENLHSLINGLIKKMDMLVEQQIETNKNLKELIDILRPQSIDIM